MLILWDLTQIWLGSSMVPGPLGRATMQSRNINTLCKYNATFFALPAILRYDSSGSVKYVGFGNIFNLRTVRKSLNSVSFHFPVFSISLCLVPMNETAILTVSGGKELNISDADALTF